MISSRRWSGYVEGLQAHQSSAVTGLISSRRWSGYVEGRMWTRPASTSRRFLPDDGRATLKVAGHVTWCEGCRFLPDDGRATLKEHLRARHLVDLQRFLPDDGRATLKDLDFVALDADHRDFFPTMVGLR